MAQSIREIIDTLRNIIRPPQPLSPETTRFADTDRWLSPNERRHP